MTDEALLWVSSGLILCLAATLVIRTVLVERAAGDGGGAPVLFRRPLAVRRLDLLGVLLAVLLVSAGVLRVFLGTIG